MLVWRNADAVIFNPQPDQIGGLLLGPETNLRLDARFHKFEGVAQEVGENLRQGPFMRLYHWEWFNGLDLSVALFDLDGALEERTSPRILNVGRADLQFRA